MINQNIIKQILKIKAEENEELSKLSSDFTTIATTTAKELLSKTNADKIAKHFEISNKYCNKIKEFLKKLQEISTTFRF